MSNNLLDRVKNAGSIKTADILSESILFNMKDSIPSDVPIINLAFSGRVDGGFTTGLTVLSGESKTFKTMLSLLCIKAYFDKYKDAICLFYDCEYGTTPEYIKSLGIDPARIVHVPIEHVEQLKFDIVKRLDEIKRGDKVFILLDSLGNLASKKEVEDAMNENTAADMSRAKAIRSLLRIITPHLTTKNLPCIMVNHVYKEIGLFPKDVIPGGTAVTYASNQIFIISKAQEKDGTDLAGYKFTISIFKSRFVREKAKFPFTVMYEKGLVKWSGMFEVAEAAGFIIKPKVGWYQVIDPDTGEVGEKLYRAKDLYNDEKFWKWMTSKEGFKSKVAGMYQLGIGELMQGNEDESKWEEIDEEVND